MGTTSLNESDSSVPFSLPEVQELRDIRAETNLELSLWFPDQRVSNLNLTRVEQQLLLSLETLFCDIRSTSVKMLDSSDTLCVLEEKLSGSDSSLFSVEARQALLPWQEMDATILLAPYVSRLDERYASEQEAHFSWTTWKVTFTVSQLGVPMIQRGIRQLEKSDTDITANLAYMAGIQELQQIMAKEMTESIRSGDFDIILLKKLNEATAISSPVGAELELFDFLGWESTKDASERGVDSATVDGSDSSREKTIIVATICASFIVVVALVGFFVVRPHSSRIAWKREREAHILDDIEKEAAKEHHLNSIKREVVREPGSTKKRASTDSAQADGVVSAAPFPSDVYAVRKVDEISEHPGDIVSVLDSVDDCYTWSVDGLDAPWKAYPAPSTDSKSDEEEV